MYCVKCRRVTETENITIATSKHGRLMRRVNASPVVKLTLNLLKKELLVKVFFIPLRIISLSKCIYTDIPLLVREQNSIKD